MVGSHARSACVALALLAYGCGDDGGASLAAAAIGPAGGTLEAGGARVDVPAGALAAELVLTIEEARDVPPGNVGQALDLGPDGTVFAAPVRLTFAYPTSLPPGVTAGDLRIATVEARGWVPLAGQQLDLELRTVSGTTTHFSPFGVITMGDSADGGSPDVGVPDGSVALPDADTTPTDGGIVLPTDGGVTPSDGSVSTDGGSTSFCDTPCGLETDGLSCAGCTSASCAGEGFRCSCEDQGTVPPSYLWACGPPADAGAPDGSTPDAASDAGGMIFLDSGPGDGLPLCETSTPCRFDNDGQSCSACPALSCTAPTGPGTLECVCTSGSFVCTIRG